MDSTTEHPFQFVQAPIYEMCESGAVVPNSLFHRPLDHLHSRCIEYPYCASRVLATDQRLLDVGSAKADKTWLAWLEAMPMEVHAVDYDSPAAPPDKIRFACADVRAMPYPDAWFDTVLAVSVIEHIGLADPQVRRPDQPTVDEAGDAAAIREIARVLKPGGRLVMTVPFGRAGIILRRQARSYNRAALSRFDEFLLPSELEVYEYRPDDRFHRGIETDIKRSLSSALVTTVRWLFRIHLHAAGAITWQRVPIETCKAVHRWHVGAVVCGVWTKPSRPV